MTDSLRPDKGNSYRWLNTITAAVGDEDGYRFGTADIRTIDERLELMGLKEGKPQAQVAYSNGRVNEISTHTQWKAVKGEQTEKISLPLFEWNKSGKRFVDAVFWSDGGVYADADRRPLSRDFGWGARLLIKLE